jgi:hypothetical protein
MVLEYRNLAFIEEEESAKRCAFLLLFSQPDLIIFGRKKTFDNWL